MALGAEDVNVQWCKAMMTMMIFKEGGVDSMAALFLILLDVR